jgi:hypothetical protein
MVLCVVLHRGGRALNVAVTKRTNTASNAMATMRGNRLRTIHRNLHRRHASSPIFAMLRRVDSNGKGRTASKTLVLKLGLKGVQKFFLFSSNVFSCVIDVEPAATVNLRYFEAAS